MNPLVYNAIADDVTGIAPTYDWRPDGNGDTTVLFRFGQDPQRYNRASLETAIANVKASRESYKSFSAYRDALTMFQVGLSTLPKLEAQS